ncbi:MAG: BACON domain-containing protein [Muribaculaceae bacterium]
MKHFRAIYFVGAVMALAGCTNQELTSDMTLSYTPKSIWVGATSVTFGASDNLTATLPVKAMNTSWNISGEPEWVAVSPKQGESSANVSLTAQENKSADESRVGVLNFKASDFNVDKMISVSQSQAKAEITPSTTSISAKAAASSENVIVTANVEWVATCESTWITLGKSGNTLNVAWQENTGVPRSTTVHLKRVSTGSTLATIQVAQGEAGVTGSTETMTFDVNGEEKTYTFDAEASWTATTSDASWLTVSPANGSAGTKQVKITALPNYQTNDRSGFVYIKIGDATKLEIPVRQTGVKMSVSESAVKFESGAETKTVTITSNVAWQIIDKPSWIKVAPQTGAIGATTVEISANENVNSDSRNGRVSFAISGGTNSIVSVSVSQNGAHLSEVPNVLEITSYAQSVAIDVTATGLWMVSASSDWIKVSPTEHTGDGVLVIDVEENTSEVKRTGTVTIIQPGMQDTQTITINQEGKTFTVDCSDVIASANPCTVSLSVASGVNWMVESEVNWLTPSPMQGSGNGEIKVGVAFNPSVTKRDGNLKFNADGKGTTLFSFSQPGRTVSVDAELIAFSSSGGESQVVTVAADGEFEVTANREWITVNRRPGANTFTITVPALTAEAARGGEVVIKLTGVPSGEGTLTRTIKVTQAITSVGLGGFEDDEDWN